MLLLAWCRPLDTGRFPSRDSLTLTKPAGSRRHGSTGHHEFGTYGGTIKDTIPRVVFYGQMKQTNNGFNRFNKQPLERLPRPRINWRDARS